MKAAETRSLGAETRSLLKRAIEIDPKFAMAYAQLGLSDIGTAARNVAKAYELRGQVLSFGDAHWSPCQLRSKIPHSSV